MSVLSDRLAEMPTLHAVPKRPSRTTPGTDGASPLRPATGRRSNKDAVNARRACENCTPPANMSSFNQPPTSAARATKRARPSPDNSRQVRSFRRRASPRPLRHGLLLESWQTRHVAGRHQSGVNRQLRTMPQVARQRPPPSDAQKDIRGDSGSHTCAAAHSNENPVFPETPATAHAARWWLNISSWRPHRQVRMDRGRGRGRVLHN